MWLAVILGLGVGAQWLAWRTRLPSILMLLAAGLLVGPVARLLTPHLFGHGVSLDLNHLIQTDQLLNLVSLAVGLILFEGGLSLNFRGIVGVRRVVWLLVTVGAFITWCVATLSARWLLGLSFNLSALLGAVLIVTGPTVVGPLLRHIRPTGKSGGVLRWEGIVIDPIGAMIAVLVFEAIASGVSISHGASLLPTSGAMLTGATVTICGGAAVGMAAAGVLVLLISRFWVPDYLQVPIALTTAIVALIASNQLIHDSGLFTVTIMGVVLANQQKVVIRHIVEFKESLTVVLIGMLFIVLAARIEIATLREIRPAVILFLLALVLIGRPLSVFVSSIGSPLTWRERTFIASMAPRGIIAAAVASVFSLRLQEQNIPQAKLLVPYVFLVIVCTVALYGLTGGWIARRLGLARAGNTGFLIVGADKLAREIARAVNDEGIELLLVDTSLANVRDARLTGLPAISANALSSQVAERIELSGIGRLLAMTSNDEVNSLAAVHYGKQFGRSAVFQLPERGRAQPVLSKQKTHQELTGRILFGADLTHDQLQSRLHDGARIHKTKLTPEFDYAEYRKRYGASAVALFIMSETGDLTPCTSDVAAAPRAGQSVIALVNRDASDLPKPATAAPEAAADESSKPRSESA
ncbi:MAG TPA: cation:proton antiporter [Tepidisphaeraceae bacterium]|jgi:NhaP-type Na+/H+ or K+/H+ antiporter|nr:cation:proton antiporter [Tepidisphaeraceae bacterium]